MYEIQTLKRFAGSPRQACLPTDLYYGKAGRGPESFPTAIIQ